MEVFQTVTDINIANIIKEKLVSEGLQCEISADDLGGMHGFLSSAFGIRILINKADFPLAKQILESSEISDDELTKLALDNNTEHHKVPSSTLNNNKPDKPSLIKNFYGSCFLALFAPVLGHFILLKNLVQVWNSEVKLTAKESFMLWHNCFYTATCYFTYIRL